MVGIAEKAYLHRVQYISPKNKDLPVDVDPGYLNLGQMMSDCITNLVYTEASGGMDYYTADFNENWKFTFQVETGKRISLDTIILMKMDTGDVATVWPIVHDVYYGNDGLYHFTVDSGDIRTCFAIDEKTIRDNITHTIQYSSENSRFTVRYGNGNHISTNVSRGVFGEIMRKVGSQNISLDDSPTTNTELWITSGIGIAATVGTAVYCWFH